VAKTIWQQRIEPRKYNVEVRVWCAEDYQFRLHETKNVDWNFGQYIVVNVLDSAMKNIK